MLDEGCIVSVNDKIKAIEDLEALKAYLITQFTFTMDQLKLSHATTHMVTLSFESEVNPPQPAKE